MDLLPDGGGIRAREALESPGAARVRVDEARDVQDAAVDNHPVWRTEAGQLNHV